MPLHKMVTDGRTIVQTFPGTDLPAVTYSVDDLPDSATEHVLMRGLRKVLSDELAGFTGDAKAAREKCLKKHKDLCAGIIRAPLVGMPTEPQLAKAFRELAPDATEAAIEVRVRELHPDHATDDKDRGKRRTKLKRAMTESAALREALERAGFTPPAPTDVADLLGDLAG